jgi:hypothetical protein
MHALFAIEPRALNNWPNLRYAVEKFGYSKGMLIARYPKAWMRMVIDACTENDVGDIEKAKIVEKLNQIKQDRLYKFGKPYPEGSWVENVEGHDVLGALDAVLLRSDKEGLKFFAIDDVPEEIFENRREKRVLRNARELAMVSKNVLANCRTLTLIDAYFQSAMKCTKVLTEMITLSKSTGCGITDVIIHISYSKDPKALANLKSDYKELLDVCFSDGLTLTINRWRDGDIDLDIHARYLITDNGGIRYDRGFVEPNDQAQKAMNTDVICMESAMVENVLSDFLISISDDRLVDTLTITG